MLGGLIDLDLPTIYAETDKVKADHAMTCLQLYDVALNEDQIHRTMDLCNDLSKYSANHRLKCRCTSIT